MKKLLISVAVVLVAGVLSAAEVKPEIGASPVKGPKTARVTIFEFSDFQCPYCSQVNPTLDEVMKKHKDDVKLVYKFLPLRQLHPQAEIAARAAVAAQNQGKFWEMHDLMFKNQGDLTKEDLVKYAKQLKLDTKKFEKDLDAKATTERIKKDEELADNLGFHGTPSFWIKGEAIKGAESASAFDAAIEKALK